MAISVPSQKTTGFARYDSQSVVTPTPGNWLIAVHICKETDGSQPNFCVSDASRNLWTLIYSGAVRASAFNSSAQLTAQVWAAPAVTYAGMPSLSVYTCAANGSAQDVLSGCVNVFEVAGMANTYLTVDSVTVATASGATSLSITLPPPTGGADCLMVGVAGTDNTTGTVSVSGTGWTALSQSTRSGPSATNVSAWAESTAGSTVSWSSTVTTNWAAVAVAIRSAGTAPPQLNPFRPAVEFQLGLGQAIATPVNSVNWTSLQNRLLDFSTQRGIQYELGYVQSSPTNMTLRNDDGAFNPRPGGSGTAVAGGTTATLVMSNASGSTVSVSDFFQLQNASGALKELTVFQVTSIAAATNTTVTFARADGGAGGAQVATATGDVYLACPVDVYVPFRILGSWNGVRYPVCVGWIERWSQTWDDPHWGTIKAVGVDVLATLSAKDVNPTPGEIQARGPQSYWPLNDASGSATAFNQGTGSTVLTVTQSTHGHGANGGGNFGATTQKATNDGAVGAYGNGTASSIIGDNGGAFKSDGLTSAELPTQGYALVGQPGNNSTFPPVSGGVTICGVWYQTVNQAVAQNSATSNGTMMVARDSTVTGAAGTLINIAVKKTSSPFFTVTVWDKTSHASTTTNITNVNPPEGSFTFWALTFNQTSWAFYATGNNSFTTGTCNLQATWGLIDLLGEADSSNNGNFVLGTLAHVAIFPRRLTFLECQSIEWSVTYGYPFSGGINDAIRSKLFYINWRGTRALNFTNFTPGSDLLGSSSTAAKIAQIADYENGMLFADAAGSLQFRCSSNLSAQTPRATLGDRPDLGEIPYIGDASNLEVDFDSTFLYNSVSITNGGLVATWNPSAAARTFVVNNRASQTKYGTRTIGKTVSLYNDSQASGVATSLLNKYALPKQRVSTVHIDTLKTQSWIFALSVEVGDIVAFNRRPIGAPVISIQCIVLQVAHSVALNKWETVLTLAPR